MRDTLECYKILDLPAGAPPQAVRKAYVALCHVWHPDRFVDNPILRERAATKMVEIQEAYETLRDFLPELQGPEPAEPAEPEADRDEALWESEGATVDREWPLRYAVIAFILVIVVALGALGVVLYLKQRSLSAAPPIP